LIYDRAYLRRRRDAGWLPSYQTGRISRERAVETGYKQLARLASTIEAHTGAALEGRRALDFGCGWGRLAVPLAERCEHVYGVDVSPAVLAEAERNAQRGEVENVEWLQVDRLAELSGRYDLLISVLVFQHIPVRQGERLFATLVEGLRADGVGAVNLVLRPHDPRRELLRVVRGSLPLARGRGDGEAHRNGAGSQTPRSYVRTLLGSYSLNQIGRLLADAGVRSWSVELMRAPSSSSFDTATVFFRKS
jgi:trans-aconitate methyltransferase